jgi:hypothetical protein
MARIRKLTKEELSRMGDMIDCPHCKTPIEWNDYYCCSGRQMDYVRMLVKKLDERGVGRYPWCNRRVPLWMELLRWLDLEK